MNGTQQLQDNADCSLERNPVEISRPEQMSAVICKQLAPLPTSTRLSDFITRTFEGGSRACTLLCVNHDHDHAAAAIVSHSANLVSA